MKQLKSIKKEESIKLNVKSERNDKPITTSSKDSNYFLTQVKKLSRKNLHKKHVIKKIDPKYFRATKFKFKMVDLQQVKPDSKSKSKLVKSKLVKSFFSDDDLQPKK